MEHVIRALRPIAQWWSRLCYHIEFEGVEHVPLEGAVIFTPNHVSYPDPIWISIPVNRRVYYMAWDALFRIPVFASILRLFGAFPVRIEGHDKCAIREAREHIAAGHALMIFPEGGRTTTGKLLGFKPGAFRLALLTGTPVVPVTINGAHEVWPVGRLLPRLGGRIRVIFHPPIPVARVPEDIETPELKHMARQLAGQARYTVASTLDPWLVPEYLQDHGTEHSTLAADH
jgi:1-acyl-sn-glycerol-3-phosphate acyltransferase